MRISGRWWPSLEFQALQNLIGCPSGDHYSQDLHVAYGPSGPPKQAVIVLKSFPDSLKHQLPEDAPRRPEDWSRLVACKTTKERWAVLKDFGATEYDDVKMCPDVPNLLEAGVTEGRHYEELLKKMYDGEYRARWVDEMSGHRD